MRRKLRACSLQPLSLSPSLIYGREIGCWQHCRNLQSGCICGLLSSKHASTQAHKQGRECIRSPIDLHLSILLKARLRFHPPSTLPPPCGRVHVWSHVRTFACTYLTYPPRNLSSIPVHSIPYVRPHTLLLSELPHLGIHLLIDRPVRHARDALFACYLIDACADVSACVCVCARVCACVGWRCLA